MSTYRDIWAILRQDAYGPETYDKIASATPDVFEDGPSLHGGTVQRGHLLGAALYYRCPSRYLRLICDSTKDENIIRTGWEDLMMVRVSKEHALCFMDAVDTHPSLSWFKLAARIEHRVWFWNEVVRQQAPYLNEKDTTILCAYLEDGRCQIPTSVWTIIRDIFDLAEGAG